MNSRLNSTNAASLHVYRITTTTFTGTFYMLCIHVLGTVKSRKQVLFQMHARIFTMFIMFTAKPKQQCEDIRCKLLQDCDKYLFQHYWCSLKISS